jgi:hypothetical protein
MSGKNKRDRFAQANPFSLTEEPEPFTFKQSDSELFGEIAKVDDAKIVTHAIPIEQIYPNTIQPRRVLPPVIRALWDGEPQSLGTVFTQWEQYINQERQERGNAEQFNVERVLLTQEETDLENASQVALGPLEETFLEIINLAASIHRDGLMHPISTVHVRADKMYIIETGERRWLAFQLLASMFPKEHQWKRIPARTVNHISVWRQAAENSARQNLNGIGKARQFALLMMDLLQADGTVAFQPPNNFEHEKDFYAQVAGGADYRIPRGKGEMLLAAMGLKHGRDLKQLRAILRLPRETWDVADYLNWTVGKLDQLTSLPYDEAIRLTCTMALQEGYMGEISPICDEPPTKRTKQATQNRVLAQWDKHITSIKKITARQVQSMPDDEKQVLRRELEALEAWIERTKKYL